MDKETYKKLDGVGLAEQIASKEVSGEEVLRTAVELLEAANEELNAVARTRFEAATDEGKMIKQQEDTPFAGVPIVLKDLSQSIAGEANLAGTRLLEGAKAETTSHLVTGLQQAGCVPIAYSTTPA